MKVGKEIRVLKKLNSKIISSVSTLGSSLRSRRYSFFKAVFLGAILLNITLLPINVSLGVSQAAVGSAVVNPWWPKSGSHLLGAQSFKAALDGVDPDTYEMFWSVEGGSWNWMDTNRSDAPHKESRVDVSGWTWKGSGPYSINFIARQNGAIVSEQAVSVYIDGQAGLAPAPAPAPVPQALPSTPAPEAPAAWIDPDPVHQAQALAQKAAQQPVQAPQAAAAAPASSGNALAGLKLYVPANSSAKSQANAWRSSRPADAAKMDYLAAQPAASWFGGWNGDVQGDVSRVISAAQKSGATPVLVAYNIPGRDCGGYSAGGTSKEQYTAWIGAVARGIGSASAIVILEPDALAGISCLSPADQQARTDLLASAVSIFKSSSKTKVYLDAGHAGWVDAAAMAERLQKAGIARADGFSLGVSNFGATASESGYGSKLSALLQGKHFVVDTSRNGNGSNGEWCNPWGRATGEKPTVATGNALADAYLWIKTPGESDGSCNGGPSAGEWWPEYALALVK